MHHDWRASEAGGKLLGMLKTNSFSRGVLFTTEPMVVRALAAELRHDPERARTILGRAVGVDLASLTEIHCESSDHGNLDIITTFGVETVGIEAKIAARVSLEQLLKEAATVTHLVLLVKDEVDVPQEAKRLRNISVCTWRDLLDGLVEARVTIDDVDAINDFKRVNRAMLNEVMPSELPEGWTTESKDGESGSPSLVLYSPEVVAGREIVVLIEADRKSPHTPGRFLANVGVRVSLEDFDAVPAQEPDWVLVLRHLGPALESRLRGTTAALSTNPGHRTGPRGHVKMDTAEKYGLPKHYATGYVTSCVGMRTPILDASQEAHRLQDMVEALLPAVFETVGQMQQT